MALSRLGDYIELTDNKNTDLQFDVTDVKGISIKKIFIPTKADMDGVPLTSYKIVKPLEFCYVTITSRNGEKITLALNDSDQTYICSSSYVAFKIKDSTKILPFYLYMYFNRPEFDRYSRFNSWGSAREAFGWEDMCDIEIDIPSIEVQQKVVDVYLAMVANQKVYENGLEDMGLTYESYIENIRKNTESLEIKEYIYEKNEKNINRSIRTAIGVGKNGIFESKRTANKDNIESCKIVDHKNIVWASQTTCGIGLGAVDMYNKYENAIIAPTCNVIATNTNLLLPEYLLMWLRREEFWRYAIFYGSGVVDKFDFELMGEVRIPIPSLSIQESIIKVYKLYGKRREINEKLKKQINDICPVLIKGSIDLIK